MVWILMSDLQLPASHFSSVFRNIEDEISQPRSLHALWIKCFRPVLITNNQAVEIACYADLQTSWVIVAKE